LDPSGGGLKAFKHDVEVMYENATKFNEDDTLYYKEAARVRKKAAILIEKVGLKTYIQHIHDNMHHTSQHNQRSRP
jgi:hypothetical protein